MAATSSRRGAALFSTLCYMLWCWCWDVFPSVTHTQKCLEPADDYVSTGHVGAWAVTAGVHSPFRAWESIPALWQLRQWAT